MRSVIGSLHRSHGQAKVKPSDGEIGSTSEITLDDPAHRGNDSDAVTRAESAPPAKALSFPVDGLLFGMVCVHGQGGGKGGDGKGARSAKGASGRDRRGVVVLSRV